MSAPMKIEQAWLDAYTNVVQNFTPLDASTVNECLRLALSAVAPLIRAAALEEAAAALKERDDYLAMFGGCGDGGCIVVKPKGQHTNGGCRCNSDKQVMHKLAYASNRFADRIRAIATTGGQS